MLGSVTYFIMNKYLYVGCTCLQKYPLYLEHKGFENRKLNDISGIGIPELLMNIMSCHGFVNYEKSTVIFSCHRKLITYYLSKGFVIPNNNSSALRDVPLRVKKRMNNENLHRNDFVIECNRAIPSAANTLKIIQICAALFTEFSSTYYNYKGDKFGFLFRGYIKPSLKSIHNPVFI